MVKTSFQIKQSRADDQTSCCSIFIELFYVFSHVSQWNINWKTLVLEVSLSWSSNVFLGMYSVKKCLKYPNKICDGKA